MGAFVPTLDQAKQEVRGGLLRAKILYASSDLPLHKALEINREV